jgi:hypothetical protein
MIVYHKNNEIDREQWDNCIKNSSGAKPYAFSWYLDIMSPGWQALVDDDYDSVFPVPCFSMLGIQYVITPSYMQQLGAFSPDKPASEAILEFLEYMPDVYRYIDLCIGQKIHVEKYRVTEKSNFELDLSRSYEKIWESFSHHCRKSIDISSKKKHEIVNDITPDEIIGFAIRDNLRNISRVKMRDLQRLKVLMNFCVKNKKGRIWGIRASRKKLIFGVFIIETNGNKTLGYIFNTPESVNRKLGYFVINELIKEFSSKRSVVDFAGLSFPSTEPLAESFGCVHVPYYRIYRNRLFWPVRMMK